MLGQEEIKKDSVSSGLESKEQGLKIPDPVYYDTIEFEDDGKLISYTDCWQISVLRFLHLIFGDQGKINSTKLTHLMDSENQNCKRLIEYFQQNPTYHYEEEFYRTKEGFLIRAEWAQFLNRSGLFYLKRNDGKHQVAATIPNLIAFYKGYFPKLSFSKELEDLTYENIRQKKLFQSYETVLSEIYRQFSKVSGIDLKLGLQTEFSGEVETRSMEMVYFSTIQLITVNNCPYPQLEWQIYEYYYIDDKLKVGSRAMGHSDYRYSKQEKEKIQSKNAK